MNILEQLKSFVGKEFLESQSPFMRWLNPIIKSTEKGHIEFEYTVRKEFMI
ncbi:hypothetical protein [Flavivirga sp. 57AJ16]|uniref:hypothetical protein n=1 Tax=Flavivirga sp. 57AJ16 TaxID=3025307 RepID=UPI002365507F|nr:hypothetical protein [Flavivirga sp. 57AJ16]MDD7886966.1 hypothetical protein [Flavivirga sp. 57AJ16]